MRLYSVLMLVALAGVVLIAGVQADSAADLLWKGNALTQMGMYDKAIDALDASIKTKASAEAYAVKGEALDKLGKHDEALAAYDASALTDPNYAGAWVGKGKVFAELKKYDQALIVFNQAILLDPKNGAAWAGKADALNALGRMDESQKATGKAKDFGFAANLS